jgi:hypothetical protein
LASAANTNGNSKQGSGIEELLPLDAVERVACMQNRGHVYRHIFRRITAADWKAFFTNVGLKVADAGRDTSQMVGTEAAALALYSDAILRADGYEMADGRKPEEQPSWPRCIPLAARVTAVELLRKITGAAVEKAVASGAKAMSVRIDALWNEGEHGAMKQYIGLVHHFRSPTAEHRKRFINLGNAGFAMTKGTRRQGVVLPSSNADLVSLYDELIERVEGYSIFGRELDGRDEIGLEMDTCHKAASVTKIFPASVDQVK